MKGCSARQISRLNFARGNIHALVSLFPSMAVRSAVPSIFRQRFFSGAGGDDVPPFRESESACVFVAALVAFTAASALACPSLAFAISGCNAAVRLFRSASRSLV